MRGEGQYHGLLVLPRGEERTKGGIGWGVTMVYIFLPRRCRRRVFSELFHNDGTELIAVLIHTRPLVNRRSRRTTRRGIPGL